MMDKFPLNHNSQRPSLIVATPNINVRNGHQDVFPQSPFEDPIEELELIDLFDEDGMPPMPQAHFLNNDSSPDHVMKRHRWGTTRNKNGKPRKEKTAKRPSMLSSGSKILRNNSKQSKLSHRRNHSNTSDVINDYNDSRVEEELENLSGGDASIMETSSGDITDRKNEKRTIVFNVPLPEDYIDPETGKTIIQYPRNKIRTTKYTPLSFLPKNISNQFLHNVANIYFLALLILGAFPIFGVPSPVMAAVPLIVIVIITAIKDAVEDSRRTITDMEVNNQTAHILVAAKDSGCDYQNVNVNEESVLVWRKFKKANSRQMWRFLAWAQAMKSKESRAQYAREKQNKAAGILNEDEANRKSFDSAISALSHADMGRSSVDLALSRHSTNPFGDGARQSFQFRPRASRQLRRQTRSLKFAKKYWKDVNVGDILRIYNNDEIPADVIILSSSDEDNCCYVETKNLDGETNLKVKQALKFSSATYPIKRADDLLNHHFQVESEGPHANLYSYEGNLRYWLPDGDSKQEAITINNMLLRGCSLRNTKWVIGIVAFTGNDSKIMLNAGITPTKQSRISRELNYYVILNFVLLFVICFLSGLISGLDYRSVRNSRDFFEYGTAAGTPAKNGIVNFFVAVILYQSLVPISLYITIEIIKTAQVYFIYSDLGMYYAKLDYPCTPKSWSISDDLGQIEYIFSDKTGTLTQNLMEFKKCTINGISYGLAYTEALAGLRKRQGVDVEAEAAAERVKIEKDHEIMIRELRQYANCNLDYLDELSFVSSRFVADLTGVSGKTQKECNEHFMLGLALCHSVVVEEDPKNPKKLVLKAQSPDEAALVGTARSLGFQFTATTRRGVMLNIHGVDKEYQVLNVLEFNSTRKRMSAIIKLANEDPSKDPKVLLICKGADSIIYSRLSRKNNDPKLLDTTLKQLEEYATEGLRTLCIAERELTWSEYQEWNERHAEAASALDGRDEKIEAVADSIERELVLLGGTAIEDKLQDGVPETISVLADAGIKLWVLTGDKVETAINIGFSCNLLGNEMDLLLLKTKLSKEEQDSLDVPNYGDISEHNLIDYLISMYLSKHFNMRGLIDEIEEACKDHSPPNEGFGVVIDGDALKIALADADTRRKFLLLCKQCKAVLCCRVSPAQKAAVVKMTKDTLDVMTLAIGDGSNDVAMIQAADVGVGIAGEEGRQAVMSSDYAVGQFRFLARLLLVHGRWSYKRFSEMIPCFFFKNVIFTVALFWYGVFDGFDGTYLFEFTYLMFYNLAFTSLPIIFLGIFDQDVSAKVSLLVPQIYRLGITRSEWTELKFWWYMLDAVYQLAISYFFPHLMYYISFPGENGRVLDHRFWMGVVVTCISCISCNLYILFRQYRWDWLSSLIVFISIMLLFIWTGLWSVDLIAGEFFKSAPEIFGALSFWACMFVGILACLMPRFFYDCVQRLLYPRDIDILREMVQRGDFNAYPETYDPTDPKRPKIAPSTLAGVQRGSLLIDPSSSLKPLLPSLHTPMGQSSPRRGSRDFQTADSRYSNNFDFTDASFAVGGSMSSPNTLSHPTSTDRYMPSKVPETDTSTIITEEIPMQEFEQHVMDVAHLKRRPSSGH